MFKSHFFYIGLVLGGLLGLIPGFGLGVYYLPIIVAEEGADAATLNVAKTMTQRRGSFIRDLPGSDGAHWGEGTIIESLENGQYYYTLEGQLAPGPDYKLYLVPQFVDDAAGFLQIKARSQRVAAINGFDNFRVVAPMTVTPNDFKAVVIWCERFEAFITAAELN